MLVNITVEKIVKLIGADMFGDFPATKLAGMIGNAEYYSVCFAGSCLTKIHLDTRKDHLEQNYPKKQQEMGE